MVQYLEKYKQNIAIDMRKRGMSYSEIQNRINIPKSTLSSWLRNVKLSEDQLKNLNEKQVEGAKKGVQRKIKKHSRMLKEIEEASSQAINKISKREAWLMGTILYWKNEGTAYNVRNGVCFSSSSPEQIRFFLKWLCDIGQITIGEIEPDIFIHESKKERASEARAYWSKVTSIPALKFTHIYFQKRRIKKHPLRRSNMLEYGFLRIRVRSSSMLARQILSWIKAIKTYINIAKFSH